jgi:CRP-like cAMP-binding protein
MLPTSVLREELAQRGALDQMLHSYMHLLMTQISQSVLCNRVHTVEERLCRWLLVVRDSLQSDEFDLTHEFIARMLGVRRSGVTIAVGILQQSGLIETTRGHISILSGEKIENSACECYSAIRRQFHAYDERLAV